jgi:hypothetical protein
LIPGQGVHEELKESQPPLHHRVKASVWTIVVVALKRESGFAEAFDLVFVFRHTGSASIAGTRL